MMTDNLISLAVVVIALTALAICVRVGVLVRRRVRYRSVRSFGTLRTYLAVMLPCTCAPGAPDIYCRAPLQASMISVFTLWLGLPDDAQLAHLERTLEDLEDLENHDYRLLTGECADYANDGRYQGQPADEVGPPGAESA